MELECHVVDLTDALDATTFKSHIRRGGMSAFVAQLIPVEGSDIIRTNCTNLISSSHPDALTCREELRGMAVSTFRLCSFYLAFILF